MLQGWTEWSVENLLSEKDKEAAMFDRLDDILIHYEELMLELNSPAVAEDQNRFS